MRQRPAVLALLLCGIAVSLPCPARGAEIVLGQDGRYTGMVLSIDGSISTDWSLVSKLKAAFQLASQFLAVATKPIMNGTKSYAFGSLQFLLPAHWDNNNNHGFGNYAVAGRPAADRMIGEDDAHFRVHESDSEEPWTPQPFGCGQPGLFTLLHRAYVTALDVTNLAHSIVHEFAHLRWGVFDEFNDHAGPHAYVKGGRLFPVRCTEALQGALAHNETGGSCRVDRVTLKLEPHCRYFLRDAQPTARASLMYVNHLAEVRHFCATVGDPQLAHNRDAPNPHNTRCLGASVRDVLAGHGDFRLGPEITDPDTRVNFTEVRPRTDRRLVIVMDLSRSMRGEPLEKMKQSMQSLLHLLEDGVQLALIAYSTDVRVLMPLRPVNGTADRQLYWELVRNLTAQGVTATGDALAAAMELLGCDLDQPSKLDSGQVVLITDGEENSRTRYSLSDITDIARQTSVSIDTVAFGRLADARLANLSAATGGLAHFASFIGHVNDMAEILIHLIGRGAAPADVPIILASSQLSGGSSLTLSVDASVSSDLQFFVVSRTRPADVRLRVLTPGGEVIDERSERVEHANDYELGSALLRLPGRVEAGQWQLQLAATPWPAVAAVTHSTVVSAKPAATAADWRPTLLTGFLSQSEAVLNCQTRASVHAYLIRGGANFVRPADLWARVESDEGLVASFRLYDHGAGADVQKDDGIYSAYLPLDRMSRVQYYGVSLQCLSPVSRVGSAGRFSVTGVDAGSLARLPPARVTDLACGVNITEGSVRLSWTAVGDRLDSGTAAGYRVKASATREALVDGFDAADNVTAELTAPLPAGEAQELRILPGQMPAYGGTFYLALKAESSAGLLGALSNVVAAQLSLPENLGEIEAIGTSSSPTSSTASSPESSQETSTASSQGSSMASSQGSSTTSGQGSSTASSQGSSTASSQGSSTASSQGSSTASSKGSGTASSQGSSTASSQGSSTASSQGSNTASSQGSSTASSQGSSTASSKRISTTSKAVSSQALTTETSSQQFTTGPSESISDGTGRLKLVLIAATASAVVVGALSGAVIMYMYMRLHFLHQNRKVAPSC